MMNKMNRKYSTQEMRIAADRLEEFGGRGELPAMLRQAADMMDAKKKYEYSVNPPEVNGVYQYRAGAELKAYMLQLAGFRDRTIVRREVGEWEEVK